MIILKDCNPLLIMIMHNWEKCHYAKDTMHNALNILTTGQNGSCQTVSAQNGHSYATFQHDVEHRKPVFGGDAP